MEDQKKEYSNIFDTASKLAKKVAKPKEPLADDALFAPSKDKPVPSSEEINEKFQQCKKLYEKIADSIDSTLAKQRLSLSKLKEYFENPSNFSDAEWRLIQSEKKASEKKLEELSQGKLTEQAKLMEKGSSDKTAKKTEHKPKSMQARSRWMPMR